MKFYISGIYHRPLDIRYSSFGTRDLCAISITSLYNDANGKTQHIRAYKEYPALISCTTTPLTSRQDDTTSVSLAPRSNDMGISR